MQATFACAKYFLQGVSCGRDFSKIKLYHNFFHYSLYEFVEMFNEKKSSWENAYEISECFNTTKPFMWSYELQDSRVSGVNERLEMKR